MGAVDEVKQRTDIVEVVSQYATLTKAGRNFKALCPFHSEKHPSFFVYPEQQSWHCFGACNTGGDVLAFVMKKENLSFGEALRLLAQRAGITISTRFESEAEAKGKQRIYEVNEAATQYFHDLLLSSPEAEKARNYIAKRGFSLQTIADFQLGFSFNSWEALKQYLIERGYTEDELLTAGLVVEAEGGKTHDRFRNKLMFPIPDIGGRITGFGARVLDDSLPKYVNSPQTPIFDKSSLLYGIDKAKTAIRQQDMAMIVEGYMDVITAHQNAYTNVVASMGTSLTERQVNAIKKLTKNMVLALDADTAGEEAMLRSVGYENTLDAEVRVIILPPGKDPDEVIKTDTKTWQSLAENALPVVDYTFNMAIAKLDLTTAKGKSFAVDNLLPVIARIKDKVRQAHYLQKLAQLVKIKTDRLEVALKEIRRGQLKPRPDETKASFNTNRSLLSRPVEEYCLALLLQHPELKNSRENPSPEYFENSENREIFIAWQQVNDLPSLKDKLDTTIHEYVDTLVAKSLPGNQIELKYIDCVLNLRKTYLKGLEIKRAEVLASEAETGGTEAELAKLEEQGIEVSVQLGEIFSRKGQRR